LAGVIISGSFGVDKCCTPGMQQDMSGLVHESEPDYVGEFVPVSQSNNWGAQAQPSRCSAYSGSFYFRNKYLAPEPAVGVPAPPTRESVHLPAQGSRCATAQTTLRPVARTGATSWYRVNLVRLGTQLRNRIPAVAAGHGYDRTSVQPRHTTRSTATTLPMIFAPSPGIGA